MKITLTIHYQTIPGQEIYISGSSKLFGQWNVSQAQKMIYQGNGFWKISVKTTQKTGRIEYKYLMKADSGYEVWEWGSNHFIDIKNEAIKELVIDDLWSNPPAEEKALFTSTFSKVIMKPGINQKSVPEIQADQILQFKIEVPRITSGYKVCILGNQDLLGNWDRKKAFILECGNDFPLWNRQLNAAELKFPLQYKYGIWDIDKKEVVSIEDGHDRQLLEITKTKSSFIYMKTDSHFRFPLGLWKGAGVSVPVFSLRSENSFGVGEFNDLFDFIDWAKQTGLKMVQILPVNETIASHNWLDSYPYKSISVMALHPIYMNLDNIGPLNDENLMAEFAALQKSLNKNTEVDYPEGIRS